MSNQDSTKAFDVAALSADLTEASGMLDAFAHGPAKDAGRAIETVFEKTGETIAKELRRAARSGEVDFKRMTGVILAELASLAIDQVFGVAGQSTASLFGARAYGGAVTPGGGYLVGERGPEVFYPAQSGMISPQTAGGGTVVNISLNGSATADSIIREEGRIAASLARAVSAGNRYA